MRMKKEKLLKSSLANKLAKYSAAAGAIVAISSNADAQVAYSGLQDISLSPIDNFNIDLDGGGVSDFNLTINNQNYSYSTSFGSTVYGSYCNISYAFINNMGSNSLINSGPFASALSSGFVISNSNSWSGNQELIGVKSISSYWFVNSTTSGSYSSSRTDGNFPGAGNKYIGVKFEINPGEFHYGWIQINLNEQCNELIIKDWAYETTPGDSIIAGNDGLVPTVALTTAATEPVNGDFDITITFSEVITGLEGGEIVVTNGSVKAGTLATADGGLTYTVTITPTATGDVTIALSAGVAQDNIGNDNDAATDLIVEADLTSGIDMLQEANKVLVYPNPTKGSVKIDLNNSELDINSITITDLSGRQIHNQKITNKLVNLDLSSFNKGMYILTMQTDKNSMTKKIVIE